MLDIHPDRVIEAVGKMTGSADGAGATYAKN
jgi:hypothetical protein